MKLKVISDIQPIINTWQTEVLAKLDAQYKKNGSYIGKEGNVYVYPNAYITAVKGYFQTLNNALSSYFNNNELKNAMLNERNYEMLKSDAERTSIEYQNGKLLGIIPDNQLPLGFKDFTAFMYNFSEFYNTNSTQIFNSITYKVVTETTKSSSGSSGSSGSSKTTSTQKKNITGCTVLTNLTNKLNTMKTAEVNSFNAIINHILYDCADVYCNAMKGGALGMPIYIPNEIDVSMCLVNKNIREFEIRGISYPEIIKNHNLYDPNKPKEYLQFFTPDDFKIDIPEITPILPQDNDTAIPPTYNISKVLLPLKKSIKSVSKDNNKIVLGDGSEIDIIQEKLGTAIINTFADSTSEKLFENVQYKLGDLEPDSDGYYRVPEGEISQYKLSEINKREILENMTL